MMTKTELLEMLEQEYSSPARLWRYATHWFTTDEIMEMLVYYCDDMEIEIPEELKDKYL